MSTSATNCLISGRLADYTIALTQDGQSVIVYKGDWYQIFPRGEALSFTDQTVNTDYLFNAGGSASASVSVNGCAADYTIALTQDGQSVIVYKGDWYQILPKGTSIAFTDQSVNTDYLFNAGGSNGASFSVNGCAADYTIALTQDSQSVIVYKGDWYQILPKGTSIAFTDKTVNTDYLFNGETCPTNHDPDAIDDAFSGVAGVAVTGNVLINDTDADGDHLTVSLGQGPANGTLKLNADGTFSYAPKAGFTGSDTFTYQVSDGKGGCDMATVTIKVDPAPVVATASIGDRVWLDANANGMQDAGEAGVAGVSVQLKNAAGNVIATQTTDASGNYLFDKLVAGAYTVNVVKPNGYEFTTKDVANNTLSATDSDVDATGKTDVINLAAGQKLDVVDAGLVKHAGSIGDRVWEDMNFNGVQDAGEKGIANVTVKLTDASGNVLKTTTTDANGDYRFNELASGDYKVQVVNPNGYYATKSDIGSNDAVDSDLLANGSTGTIQLGINQTLTNVDAGLYRKATIGDQAWWDANHSGTKDTAQEENGFSGITVRLLDQNNVVVATTITGTNGYYKFTDVDPGQYRVEFSAKGAYIANSYFGSRYADSTNWNWTTKDTGANDSLDSDATYGSITVNTRTDLFGVSSGQVDMTHDVGVSPIALDLNGDGKIGVTGQTSSFDKSGVTELGKTVKFDIDADGKLDTIEWFKGDGDGILVDASKIGSNGKIDGSALFGDEGGKFGNGYDKLALLDANGDGKLSGAELQTLKVWIDDGDAVLQAGELKSLADAGVAEISTRMEMVKDASGHDLMQSSATASDGSTILTEDVWFASAQNDHGAQAAHDAPVDHVAPQVEDMQHHQAHAA